MRTQEFSPALNLSRRGFTIVELLIVVVIIAILASITIAAYSGITKQAENARFLTDIDSYQKSLMLYEATTGDSALTGYEAFSEPQLDLDTGGDAVPFDWKMTLKGKCAPGNYPAGDGFGESECVRIESTFSGGEEEGQLAQVFIADDFYGSIARMRDASISVPNPTFTKGETSTIEGEIRPEDGGGHQRIIYRVRGVIQHCADQAVTSGGILRCGTVKLSYLIFGDHTCGRGEKLLTNMEGALERVMNGYPVEFPEPPETPTVTMCTLAIPQGS